MQIRQKIIFKNNFYSIKNTKYVRINIFKGVRLPTEYNKALQSKIKDNPTK